MRAEIPLQRFASSGTPGLPHDKAEIDQTHRPGILIVDDEPTLRNLLRMLLKRQGFDVWTAGNGQEALDCCREHHQDFSAVLIDVQMPGLDGPHTAEGIRELDPDMPVCFMTGNPSFREPSELLRGGASHVFLKPFDLDEVIGVVRDLAGVPPAE